jgi:hypothetical protein
MGVKRRAWPKTTSGLGDCGKVRSGSDGGPRVIAEPADMVGRHQQATSIAGRMINWCSVYILDSCHGCLAAMTGSIAHRWRKRTTASSLNSDEGSSATMRRSEFAMTSRCKKSFSRRVIA